MSPKIKKLILLGLEPGFLQNTCTLTSMAVLSCASLAFSKALPTALRFCLVGQLFVIDTKHKL